MPINPAAIGQLALVQPQDKGGAQAALTADQQDRAASVLGLAFVNDPFMAYVFPDPATRVQRLTKLFLPVIRRSCLYGGVEVAPDFGGVLTWLPGQSLAGPVQLLQLLHSGLIKVPLSMGLPAFLRLQGHEAACEHALLQRASQGFAYLWVVGVHPDSSGQGLGKRMIQSALETMRRKGHSACLLRTDNPNNVGLYEHLGFEQIHTDIPASSGFRYWLFSQELM